jgi:hypothetical protein
VSAGDTGGINRDGCELSRLRQDSSLIKIEIAMPMPRPHQLASDTFGLTVLDESGTWGSFATLDRTGCISAHEYSNSCPHFKQT